MQARDRNMKTVNKTTINNIVQDRYTINVDGEEYEYSEYVDPSTGNCDIVVVDSNATQVYDIELINEMTMYIVNEL